MGIIDNLLGRNRLPPFRHTFDVPAIAANGIKVYQLSGDLRPFRKWAPFDFLYVKNMSACDILIRFNYNPNNDIQATVKGDAHSSSIPFCNFTVINQNLTTTIAVDEVTISIEKV